VWCRIWSFSAWSMLSSSSVRIDITWLSVYSPLATAVKTNDSKRDLWIRSSRRSNRAGRISAFSSAQFRPCLISRQPLSRAPSSQSCSFLASTLVEIVFVSSTARFGGHFTQTYSLLAFTIPVNKPRNWIQSKTPAFDSLPGFIWRKLRCRWPT
jgi:hypothetical protein